jgi:hypothetical protein
LTAQAQDRSLRSRRPGAGSVNRNSEGESTVEALLALGPLARRPGVGGVAGEPPILFKTVRVEEQQ